ncbi:MAG TPA: hypothetical protein VGI20_05000 [Rhizomicrobium sp.]
MRTARLSLLPILGLAAAALALPASAHDTGTLLSECGTADLPDSAVDSCLERVRVADETQPSPQLQSLEAQLVERKSGKHPPMGAPRGMSPQATAQPRSVDSDQSGPGMFDQSVVVPSRPVMGEVDEAAPPPDRDLESPGAGPANVDRGGTESDQAPRDVPDFGSGESRSGPDTDDEPPIADPPDPPPSADDPR